MYTFMKMNNTNSYFYYIQIFNLFYSQNFRFTKKNQCQWFIYCKHLKLGSSFSVLILMGSNGVKSVFKVYFDFFSRPVVNPDLSCTLSFSELPVNIVKPLQDKTAVEKSRVILDCTVSNPRCSIRWYKGSNVILPSERFEICSEGCYRKLIIQQVALDDEGTYSVQVGEYTCSAKLTVEGKRGHDQFQALHSLRPSAS